MRKQSSTKATYIIFELPEIFGKTRRQCAPHRDLEAEAKLKSVEQTEPYKIARSLKTQESKAKRRACKSARNPSEMNR